MMPVRATVLIAWAIITGILHSGPAIAQDSSAPFRMPECGRTPSKLLMHGTAAIGDRLYVIGGLDAEGWSDKVYSAPIQANSHLGPWRLEKPLPDRRNYLVNAVEVVNDYIYIVGGLTAAAASTSEDDVSRKHNVLYTKVLADGLLDDWKESSVMPDPKISLGASCSTDKFLYLTGGSTPTLVTDNVVVADLSSSGEPKNWRIAGHMPTPLWFHGAAILDNNMYLWGGLPQRERIATNDKTYCAEVKSDGSLGAWRELLDMTQATYSASTCALNDYLISVGGRYGGSHPTNVIWYTRITGSGIEPWKMIKTDLKTRVYHSLGLDKSRGQVFITGGKEINQPGPLPGGELDIIQAFQLSQPQSAKLSATDVAAAISSGAAAGGFLALDAALVKSRESKRPCLIFFYSPEVPASKRFWDTVVKSPQYVALGARFVLSTVDVSVPAGNAKAVSWSVFKSPALALVGPDGSLVRSVTDLKNWDDVKQATAGN